VNHTLPSNCRWRGMICLSLVVGFEEKRVRIGFGSSDGQRVLGSGARSR
jgi:hypothetical protein